MRKTILALFLIISLFPIGSSFSQTIDKESALSIQIINKDDLAVYKDNDGYSIAVGEVKNTNKDTLGDIKIRVTFYDEFNNPIETASGTTILDVLPGLATSPFLIKSNTIDPKIVAASAKMETFEGSTEKPHLLEVGLDSINQGGQLVISGVIKNNGPLDSDNVEIHLLTYQKFDPPRIIRIDTITLENELLSNSDESFEFMTKYSSLPVDFKLVAESENYQSDIIDLDNVSLTPLTKLISIDENLLNDSFGNKLDSSEISVGDVINIQSAIDIQYSTTQQDIEQPYLYYVQIKQTGEQAIVEFVGNVSDTFTGTGTHFPTVTWTPQHDGLFFIETFVWDDTNRAISSPGPITLVHVQP